MKVIKFGIFTRIWCYGTLLFIFCGVINEWFDAEKDDAFERLTGVTRQ